MPVNTSTAKTTATTKDATTKPTAVPDVTGEKKKRGGKKGPRTTPSLAWSTSGLGAVTNTARTIAARNNGYVNSDMIYRELDGHPEFEKIVTGPNGSQARAYDLLSPTKVKDWYKKAVELLQTNPTTGKPNIHALTGEPVNPFVDYEDGGPKKGALPQLARTRTDVDTDEL